VLLFPALPCSLFFTHTISDLSFFCSGLAEMRGATSIAISIPPNAIEENAIRMVPHHLYQHPNFEQLTFQRIARDKY
jgi:hypothetical protein